MRQLEASFDAAVARDEDAAATDLAFSLLQERSLTEVLERRRALALIRRDGGRSRIALVGDDFVGEAPPSARLVPLAAAVFESLEEGTPPRRRHLDLTAQLRLWARSGAQVTATTPIGDVTGRLVSVSPDHLRLIGRRGEQYIGRGALLEITRIPAGSADAP